MCYIHSRQIEDESLWNYMCIEFIDNGVVDGHDLWFYILIMSISYPSQTFHNILHYDEKIMI